MSVSAPIRLLQRHPAVELVCMASLQLASKVFLKAPSRHSRSSIQRLMSETSTTYNAQFMQTWEEGSYSSRARPNASLLLGASSWKYGASANAVTLVPCLG